MPVTSRLRRPARTNESHSLSVKHLKNVLWTLCFGANHYKMCMETDKAIPANCALHCTSKCRSPHRRNWAHRWRWQLLVALVFCGHNHLNEIFIFALEVLPIVLDYATYSSRTCTARQFWFWFPPLVAKGVRRPNSARGDCILAHPDSLSTSKCTSLWMPALKQTRAESLQSWSECSQTKRKSMA